MQLVEIMFPSNTDRKLGLEKSLRRL